MNLVYDTWVSATGAASRLMGHYHAAIWLDRDSRGDRDYCAVAVGCDGGWCGDTSGMEYTDLTISTDDPDRRVTAVAEAERILADAGWHLTGEWEPSGCVLQAPARKG